MKKNRILKIGLLALALTLVTASLVSGTFAKYITTASGTGTVNVAKWYATVSDGTNKAGTGETGTVNFDLFNTIYNATDVVADRVAPGTNGSFSLTYNTTDTEVDHQVTITLEKKSGTIPTNMTFEIVAGSGLTATPATLDFNTTPKATFTTGKILAAATTGKTGTLTINWEWPFESGTDSVDTGEGFTASELKFDASFEAVQLDSDPIE
jgi:beta-mannanase